jgi:hypothetical protein
MNHMPMEHLQSGMKLVAWKGVDQEHHERQMHVSERGEEDDEPPPEYFQYYS